MKLLRLFISGMFTVCCFLTTASVEAATIALLPLVNNVVDREDLGQIYYDRGLEVTKNSQQFEIAENERLDAAVKKYVKQGELPDKAACVAIAEEGDTDVVFAMEVNQLDYTTQGVTNKNDSVLLRLRGKLVVYNALTNKYIEKVIKEDDVDSESALLRYDTTGQQFANSVTREVKRAIGDKKVRIATPKIGLGNKR